jgi:two-component system, LytTR family, response regulator
MLRVALVDDEPLGRERIRALLGEEKDVTLVGEYSTGEEALVGVLESSPQVLFLDIRMPGMDGFGLVQMLETRLAPEQRPFIVVVTAYDAYALRAFDVSAVDYLLKPFDRARFRAAMERARARVSERPRPEVRFVVRSASKVQLVRAADVEWIAGDGNYARLHSSGRRHLVRETLKSVEARLDPQKFVRVHRSAIVNVDCVATFEPHVHGQYVLTMRDGARIVSSRTHSAKLRALLKSRT